MCVCVRVCVCVCVFVRACMRVCVYVHMYYAYNATHLLNQHNQDSTSHQQVPLQDLAVKTYSTIILMYQ